MKTTIKIVTGNKKADCITFKNVLCTFINCGLFSILYMENEKQEYASYSLEQVLTVMTFEN